MKTMKQFITGAVVLGAVLSSGGQVFADQTISGENEAEIKVNGIIGEFDNTIEGPDPEHPDMWINVTLPTTALFHSNPDDITNIMSPNYRIANNSAQGVNVMISDVTEGSDINLIDQLDIVSGGTRINLLSGGEVAVSESSLFTLDNTVGGRSQYFEFEGLAMDAPTDTEVNPHFRMVFKFETVMAPGV
ncbi:hypothetical protein [Carnobacterium maltaromaticum]|uniref:hypothetical protein n=1 Tax=Carnobacterium maltaromaticum TaxID=2751 RepID=UPI00191B9849|nr:hypothetical protein [Carnobacterium maltaromaticum]CAD5903099.1 conserved exported hypothetical protein [Carnobacterium maltaromaticum]